MLDPPLPVVFDRREAVAEGLSPDQASRRARRQWARLRRGQYTVAALDDHGRWRAEVLAIVRSQGRELVLSHTSAARAWQLPAPLTGWGPVSFTCGTGPSRRRTGHTVRVAPLLPDDVVSLGAMPLTSVARTVVDCARHLPGRDALAVADAALHRCLVPRGELEKVLARQQGWPGAARARRVVGLADGRRETPFESWSAWAFDEQGVPQPAWQVTVLDAGGVFLGRVDALWREGVVGEADGRAKYRLAAQERGGADARRWRASSTTSAGARWACAGPASSSSGGILATSSNGRGRWRSPTT